MEPTKGGCPRFKGDSVIYSEPGTTLHLDLTALANEALLFVIDAEETPLASGNFVETLQGGSIAELPIARRLRRSTFPFHVVAPERPRCPPVAGTLATAIVAKLVDIIEHDN